jgi:lysophospholipase L1-like esterase
MAAPRDELPARPQVRPRARLVAAALLVALLGAACGDVEPAIRVMPLGDSITDGDSIPGGYRIELSRALEATGTRIDFVGSLRNGSPSLDDEDHEGHSGWRIDQIHAAVGVWIRTYQPDVVLLLIGTNDVWSHYRVATAPRRLGALVDRIHALRSATKIFVSTIPPFRNATLNRRAVEYNAAARRIVLARVERHRPVWFVDGGGTLTLAELADGVHPNASGYRKLAQAWYAALRGVALF